MAATQTLTRLVSAGNGVITANVIGLEVDYASFQISGDSSVDGAVTVKLQESNTSG